MSAMDLLDGGWDPIAPAYGEDGSLSTSPRKKRVKFCENLEDANQHYRKKGSVEGADKRKKADSTDGTVLACRPLLLNLVVRGVRDGFVGCANFPCLHRGRIRKYTSRTAPEEPRYQGTCG